MKHVLLRKIGWQSIRPRPGQSVRDLHSHLERYAAHRPKSWAELLIDCEEDRTLRAVLIGMLREGRPRFISVAAAPRAR